MAPPSRTLEITVISAEDLRRRRKPLKNKSFATVKIDAQNLGTTQIDDGGGSDPFWNEKLALKLSSDVSFLTVIVHSGSFSKNEIVGTAKIPVSDFLGGFVPETYLHCLSYRLRDLRGERNGIVNVSVGVLVSDFDFYSKTPTVQIPAGITNFSGDFGGSVPIGIPISRDRHI